MSPDGFAKPPPEEKLLKLIRGKPARPATEAAAFPRPGQLMTASSQAAKGRVFRSPARAPGWPTIAMWVLGAFLVVEVIVLIVQVLRPLPPVLLRVEATAEQPAGLPSPHELPSLSASAPRTVFAPSADAPATGAAAAPLSTSTKLLAARLTLMGIVAGDPPQAIIEDSETKKTFFVTAGQMVIEDAVVEQVLDSRVVLTVAGEKIELSL